MRLFRHLAAAILLGSTRPLTPHLRHIRADLIVEMRLNILRKADGPMLKHGLQGFQGSRILVPHAERLRPNADFLAERYALFRQAA